MSSVQSEARSMQAQYSKIVRNAGEELFKEHWELRRIDAHDRTYAVMCINTDGTEDQITEPRQIQDFIDFWDGALFMLTQMRG